MRNQEINSKIVDLWDTHFSGDSNVYAPLFYDEFKSGGLLFVGLNPSFSKTAFKTILPGTEFDDIDSFFKWSKISSNHDLIDTCIEYSNIARNSYRLYFRRPAEIAVKVELAWQHIDLFLYHETNQEQIMKIIKTHGALNQFALDQIEICNHVITKIEPACIVVINAAASKILREHFDHALTWDESRGFHWFRWLEKKTPIFFSSMLSGGALDCGSYERLVWHVGQALKYR